MVVQEENRMRTHTHTHTHTHTQAQIEVNVKCDVIFFHMFPWINTELSVLLFWDVSNLIFTKWAISISLYVGNKLDECEPA